MAKKILIIFLLTILSFLISCKGKEEKEEPKEEEQEEKSEYIHLFKDLKDEEFHILNFDINDIPFVLMEKISRLSSYKKETKGETVASFLITYHQSIDDTYIKNEEENHLLTFSTSALVDVFFEAFFNQDEILMKRKAKDDFSKISYEEYESKYGLFPDGYNIEGFEITRESLLSIEKVDSSEGLYSYKIIIDGEVGSLGLKQKMKEFGSLSSLPTFSNVEMELSMKEDFTPVSINFIARYVVSYPLLGKMDCEQNYLVKYYIPE